MSISYHFFFRFFPLLLFTVVGKSMEPLFKEGEKVLAARFLQIKKQDVVILQDPRNNRLLLKRITNIKKDNVFVEGDNNSESTDSRHFGWISKDRIVGKVIFPNSHLP